MELMVTRLRYGNTNTFLIRGTFGNLLVDTDYAGTLQAFYKALKSEGLKVKDITYVIATHYHPDHCGIIGDLTEQGIKLVILDTQVQSVHFSDAIFDREPRLEYKKIDECEAEILHFGDSRGFLRELGIDGEIIPTPSHSADSVSVILDDGTCIVGDLEPYEYLDAYEDNPTLKGDWDNILKRDPKRILYAHANEKEL